PVDGRAPPCRRRVGEHVQPLRPDLAVRRLQGVRFRARGRPPRAWALPEVRRVSRPTSPPWVGYLATLHPASSLPPDPQPEAHGSAPIRRRSIHTSYRERNAP